MMERKDRAAIIVSLLEKEYPDAACSLEYKKPYELLFAARLSAQCTDARVNIITPELFAKFPTLESFAEANISDLERIIKSCGFFRIKARDISACAIKLLSDFGGEVPGTMEELLTLPGVGRKTANLILGDVFHKPAVVADTHCIRLSNRLGLTSSKDPYKVEMQLKLIIHLDKQSDFCHRLVLHGRAVCTARAPKCDRCAVSHLCSFYLGENIIAKEED